MANPVTTPLTAPVANARVLRVGITVCIDRGKRWRPGYDYLYVSRAYAARVRELGAEPVLLGLDSTPSRVPDYCDALIITGGDDLPRTLADLEQLCGGEALSEAPLGPAEDVERITWDRALLDAFSERDRCVLGVCYGMQLMNLHFGGTLYRDLSVEHAGAIGHGGGGAYTRHALKIVKAGGLWPVHSQQPLTTAINSNHRQAVRDVAPGFVATAMAEDGIVESIERRRLCGVQWHPETDPGSRGVLAAFLALCE